MLNLFKHSLISINKSERQAPGFLFTVVLERLENVTPARSEKFSFLKDLALVLLLQPWAPSRHRNANSSPLRPGVLLFDAKIYSWLDTNNLQITKKHCHLSLVQGWIPVLIDRKQPKTRAKTRSTVTLLPPMGTANICLET